MLGLSRMNNVFLSSTWNTDPRGGLAHTFAYDRYTASQTVAQHLKERNSPAVELSMCESFCTIDFWTHPNKTFTESVLVFFRNAVCAVNLSGPVFHQLSSCWLVRQGPEASRGQTASQRGIFPMRTASLVAYGCVYLHVRSFFCLRACVCVCVSKNITSFQKTVFIHTVRMHARKCCCVLVCVVLSRQYEWPRCLPYRVCN